MDANDSKIGDIEKLGGEVEGLIKKLKEANEAYYALFAIDVPEDGAVEITTEEIEVLKTSLEGLGPEYEKTFGDLIGQLREGKVSFEVYEQAMLDVAESGEKVRNSLVKVFKALGHSEKEAKEMADKLAD
jgi:hypothetical protein